MNTTIASPVKLMLLLLIGLLPVRGARAQATPKPLPGYTYKVDGGIPGKEVYISGQRPFTASGELVGANDLLAQTRQVFNNLNTARGKLGMTFRNVTQVTYHLKGAAGPAPGALSQPLNTLSTQFFTQGLPKIMDIRNVPKIARDEVLIEIEVIAVK